uniref:Uncharacterized protein n=1 Tax=Scleropages formosus TaxID=113540 RepID=A0A8C9V583_SCLFO
MHSHWNLFLFCGIFLMAFELASSKNYISENLDADITKLKVYFNISGDSSLFGNSIFLKYVATKEDAEQWLLLLEILDVYISILSRMKTHATSDVNNAINRVLCRVETLKSSYTHQGERLLKRQLQEVWATKVNKHLWSLKWCTRKPLRWPSRSIRRRTPGQGDQPADSVKDDHHSVTNIIFLTVRLKYA